MDTKKCDQSLEYGVDDQEWLYHALIFEKLHDKKNNSA